MYSDGDAIPKSVIIILSQYLKLKIMKQLKQCARNMRAILLPVILGCMFASSASAQIITTYAGTGTMSSSGDGGQATVATLVPVGIAYDPNTNRTYVTDGYVPSTRFVDGSGVINTIASGGVYLAVNSVGDIFYANSTNSQVMKIDHTTSVVTTFAGNGSSGSSGDGGPASAAQLHFVIGLAFDASDNLYISDRDENRIRKVNSSNIISTVVNKLFSGTPGFSGDGGPATAARIDGPQGICVSGNKLYIADNGNLRIREVELTGSRNIKTIAGTGTSGHTGDGGPATAAEFSLVEAMCSDPSGHIFVTDYSGYYVRRIDPGGAIINYVGNGGTGSYSSGSPATAVPIGFVWGLATNTSGELFVSCPFSNVVYKVSVPAVHNCIDTAYMEISNTTDDDGNCIFTASVTVSTINIPRSYVWNDGSTRVTHFTHASTDNFSVTLPPCSDGTIEVTINVSDTSLADSLPDGCCQSVLTQTVTCTGCEERRVSAHMDKVPISISAFAKGVRIFPNPTDNVVNVTSETGDIKSIQVVDMGGKNVAEYAYEKVKEASISLGNLPPGSYLVKINNSVSKTVTKAK